MTTKQPEALRLADELIEIASTPQLSMREVRISASKELRRLHAVNAELLDALELFIKYEDALDESDDVAGLILYADFSKKARAAFTKATGTPS